MIQLCSTPCTQKRAWESGDRVIFELTGQAAGESRTRVIGNRPLGNCIDRGFARPCHSRLNIRLTSKVEQGNLAPDTSNTPRRWTSLPWTRLYERTAVSASRWRLALGSHRGWESIMHERERDSYWPCDGDREPLRRTSHRHRGGGGRWSHHLYVGVRELWFCTGHRFWPKERLTVHD